MNRRIAFKFETPDPSPETLAIAGLEDRLSLIFRDAALAVFDQCGRWGEVHVIVEEGTYLPASPVGGCKECGADHAPFEACAVRDEGGEGIEGRGNRLTHEQIEEIAQRAKLCAEATIPGDQLRALCERALATRAWRNISDVEQDEITRLRALVDLHQLSQVWADEQVAACEIQRLQREVERLTALSEGFRKRLSWLSASPR